MPRWFDAAHDAHGEDEALAAGHAEFDERDEHLADAVSVPTTRRSSLWRRHGTAPDAYGAGEALVAARRDDG